ncbi:MAG: hypothetical protein PGN34_24515 [Methylobacterium frigidaeris]
MPGSPSRSPWRRSPGSASTGSGAGSTAGPAGPSSPTPWRGPDVAHLAGRAYPTLSGGEQARAQLARVLCQLAAGRTVAASQVLFLDEPTASLDLRHQRAVLEEAVALARRGAAVVAILHDLNLAAAYADALLVMQDGRIVARGAPAAVLRDEVIAGVFGVEWRVGQVPPAGQPFLLPQRSVAPLQHTVTP